MDFLFTTDKNYLKYLNVILISICVNHKDVADLRFHVLYNELPQADIKKTQDIVCGYGGTIFFYYVDNSLFKDFPIGKDWHISCMYILVAHKLLPQTIDRVLYLDIDMVVNGSLKEFYNIEFEDNYLIASQEYYNAKNEPAEPFEKFLKVENFDINKASRGGYFNSGALLFNLKKFREEGIDIPYYINKLSGLNYVFYDQGTLGVCFAKKTKLLTTCKYNYRISFSIPDYFNADNRHKNGLDKYKFYSIEARIIHYCGYIGIKPWILKLADGDVPYASKSYLEYVPQSVDVINVWWKYAALLPDYLYKQLLEPAELNATIYRMLYMFVNRRPYNFQNALQIETLTAPTWNGRNVVNANSNLDDYRIPKVYICDDKSKNTIKNIPADFKGDISFRLTVKRLATAVSPQSPLLQIIEADDDKASVWRRISPDNGLSWSKWNKMATIFDIEDLAPHNFYLKETCDKIGDELNDLSKRIKLLEGLNISSLVSELKSCRDELKILKIENRNINTSFSYRIGRFITWLPRKIRDAVSKTKEKIKGEYVP